MKYDLEERLISFATTAIDVIKALPNDRITNYLSQQLLRSATSPALNYGEAMAAESRRDFVHKMNISLKELRETRICLRILSNSKYLMPNDVASKECGELIAIFAKSISTARRNMT
jgi:four helix bundle protein